LFWLISRFTLSFADFCLIHKEENKTTTTTQRHQQQTGFLSCSVSGISEEGGQFKQFVLMFVLCIDKRGPAHLSSFKTLKRVNGIL
jgi:hypothetical protein